jgi:hypothetical protein
MSVFDDEWRDCLREHYKHVVRDNDRITKESLTEVLYSVGFDDAELRDLQIQATMRTEDVAEDFTPELDILEKPMVNQVADEFQPHPLECQCPACVEMNMVSHDEDGQPMEIDEQELMERAQDAEDGDEPAQMSLF